MMTGWTRFFSGLDESASDVDHQDAGKKIEFRPGLRAYRPQPIFSRPSPDF